ncbi:hypothetical protein C8J56DRAFT_784543 [Mycena floridula]|nr:hypothetical protein C8J56DRAFT_784543 [Mycena floridula]
MLAQYGLRIPNLPNQPLIDLTLGQRVSSRIQSAPWRSSWVESITCVSSNGLESEFLHILLFKAFLLAASTSIPILDCNDHLMGVLCGRPDKKKWMPEVHDPFLDAMKEARESCEFTCPEDTYHRRGTHPTLTGGISYGGGQIKPGNLQSPPDRAAAFKKLTEMECVQRISGYGNRSFQAFSKTMYREYLDTLSGIIADPDNPGLERNFEEKISCFAAATFNLGPQTVSFPHIDTKNWAEGHCLIFVGGDHDHTKGGHIVLWDLGLVIEFPAGCSILLMSAALKHSNVKIQPGETRCSFVQYTAGGLVRWLENGYQSDASILERRNPLEVAAWEERRRNRVAVAVKHAQYQYYYDSAL